MPKYQSYNINDTMSIAKEFAQTLKAGDVVALVGGEPGAGKTVFVRGIVAAMEYTGNVTSPTFTLLNEYPSTPLVYHFDVYRMESASDVECEWMDEYLFGDGICVIEWADNIKNLIPKHSIWVRIAKNIEIDDDYREIDILTEQEVLRHDTGSLS